MRGFRNGKSELSLESVFQAAFQMEPKVLTFR